MADVLHSGTSITGGHTNAVAAGAAGFMSGTDKSNLDGLNTGATQALRKDGSVAATADLPMGTHKFTGLSAGSAPGHSVRYEQVALLDGSQAFTSVISGVDPTAATNLATRNYVDFLSAILFFGDGSDGDLTISSGTTTLTRDTFYNNVTISGTAAIDTAGYTLFVAGTLDLTNAPAAAIHHNGGTGGNGAAAGTAGTAGTICTNGVTQGITTGASVAGAAGGAGGATTGTQGATSSAIGFVLGGDCQAGGKGGTGASGAGGASRAGVAGTARQYIRTAVGNPLGYVAATGAVAHFSGGISGVGGSGGGGDGTAGGGGGGGGAAPGPVKIYARTVARATATTAAGCIQSKGAAGGNGGTPAAGNRGGGGGGAGAGGASIHLVCGFLTGTAAANALDASGGNGGTGGNGTGTGTGGDGGGGGNCGAVLLHIISAGTVTAINGNSATGSAGGAASGTTGGGSGAGASARVSL